MAATRLQAAVTRALTNSRTTQKRLGKDVLSSADVGRIVDAAKEDGVSADDVKLIVSEVQRALASDKLDVSTATRQKNFNKLFDKLAAYQTIPVDTEGHTQTGAVNWMDALLNAKTPDAPSAPVQVDVVAGAAAFERIANRLLRSRSRNADGVSVASLEVAMDKATPQQKPLLQAFFDDVVKDGQLPTRDHIIQVLDTRIDTLQKADVDDSGALSAAERKTLDAVGGLAADLAKTLAAQEPVEAAAKHVFGDATGDELKGIIKNVAAEHKELSYSYARTILFSELHNDDGKVDGFYTDRTIETTGTPRNMQEQRMNTEHTFPKSKGVKNTPALSDLHHLFPTDDLTNGMRASHPFGEVTTNVEYQKDNSKLGLDANGKLVFEPPEEAKGAIARALMYVATVYDLNIDDVGGAALMQSWNAAHPPTDDEVARNAAISKHQGNRNPFVDHPDLVDRVASPGPDASGAAP